MKEIFSAWIKPSGQFIALNNYAEHDEYAGNWMRDKFGFTEMMIMLHNHKPRLDRPCEYLLSIGWIKLSKTTERLTLTYVRKEFTKRQWETVLDYMIDHNLTNESVRFDKTTL